MHPRLRLTLMTIASLAIVAAATVILTSSPRQATSARGEFTGAISPVAPPVSFSLRDEDGRGVDAATLRGQPVLVTFLYTSCQNDCPTIAAQVRAALDDTPIAVHALAISVDPARDSPAARRRFVSRHHLTGRMRFLSGSDAELQRVWRAFGIQPQVSGREHSARVVLLDGAGRQRVAFPIDQLTPEGLAHDLRLLATARPGSANAG